MSLSYDHQWCFVVRKRRRKISQHLPMENERVSGRVTLFCLVAGDQIYNLRWDKNHEQERRLDLKICIIYIYMHAYSKLEVDLNGSRIRLVSSKIYLGRTRVIRSCSKYSRPIVRKDHGVPRFGFWIYSVRFC